MSNRSADQIPLWETLTILRPFYGVSTKLENDRLTIKMSGHKTGQIVLGFTITGVQLQNVTCKLGRD